MRTVGAGSALILAAGGDALIGWTAFISSLLASLVALVTLIGFAVKTAASWRRRLHPPVRPLPPPHGSPPELYDNYAALIEEYYRLGGRP